MSNTEMDKIFCLACGSDTKATDRRKLAGDSDASKRVLRVWKSLIVDEAILKMADTGKVCR